MSGAQKAARKSFGIGIFCIGLFAFNMKTGNAILKLFVAADRSRNPGGFWPIQVIAATLALVRLVRSGLILPGRVSP